MRTTNETLPAAINSLDTYFKDISRYPLLSKEEEYDLAKRFECGEQGVRDRLINANLRLVVAQAQKFKGLGVALEDLIAEGNTGLIHAVDRFKTGMGAGLSTYAVWWIRQRMMRAIDNHGRTIRLPSHVLSQVRKIRGAVSHLTQSLGREPADEEVALHAGISEEKLARVRSASVPITSLDGKDTDNDTPMLDRIPAAVTADANPYDFACRQCDEDRVRLLLVKLPGRLRLIIERRFGLGEGDRHPLPLHDVGKELGVTRERIRQLERKALALLRQAAYRMDPASNQWLLSMDPPVSSKRVRSRRPAAKAAA